MLTMEYEPKGVIENVGDKLGRLARRSARRPENHTLKAACSLP